MMGLGGEAIAGALYALAGVASYLVVAGMLIAAVRCFRGRRIFEGARETSGAFMLLASITILLFLPFADGDVTSHGPGGLLGEWLGGISSAFIGSVGAALAATTTLVVSLLMITDVSTREVRITNRLGLHARAAARFVQTANRFRSKVTLSRDGRTMDGKSILGILLLAAAKGTVLVVAADGEDEQAAVEALAGLIDGGFGEG